MALEWCESIIKTQFIVSTGGLKITCLFHKTKVFAFKWWSKKNVSGNFRAFY